MSAQKTALLWFRQDLRLKDNAALRHAVREGYRILPVFILDNHAAGEWQRGGASRWWLHKSLQALNESLDGRLVFRCGRAGDTLMELVKESGAQAVFWNRSYEPWRITRDKQIKEQLKDNGTTVGTFKDLLLWEPWESLKDDGTPYRVFTPFYKKGCLGNGPPEKPEKAPASISYADFHGRYDVYHLDLLPDIQWYRKMESHWQPGEHGAQARLEAFIKSGLSAYKDGRDRPDQEHVSRLSPHLHFGEISPRDVWHRIQTAGTAHGLEQHADKYCSELGWREFSYNLLYHFPEITRKPLQKKFEDFSWDTDAQALRRWQKGRTGIPIVDAGMRQLWETGWMHNRVRMIVASVLVKNMLLHWHHGADWFWDCLVDADLANNSASWQWVAGCGADAAPYFRIFNPVTQGRKFDPEGDYVRRYVPALKNMPAKHIHAPWDAPEDVLGEAGVTLGDTYPLPVVDLKKSREKALAAFEKIKSAA